MRVDYFVYSVIMTTRNGENMSTENLFSENLDNLSDEVIANRILINFDINFENVPIIIEDALKNAGFRIGVANRFGKESIIAGIAYAKDEFQPLHSNKFFIFRKDLDTRDRRYVMALAISYYAIESKNEFYTKTIYQNSINEIRDEKYDRVARALLMPQKSLSTLLMSPLISKLEAGEKIEKVAKAFLVSSDIARKRMIETGFGM